MIHTRIADVTHPTPAPRPHAGPAAVRGGPPVTDPGFETVVALLDDEYARAVLAATDGRARSATELAATLDASKQTVYRRLERLREAGLVAEATRPRSDGHHETVYTATLERVSVELREGEFAVEVETDGERDAADTLTDLWRRFP
ncbi:winged helix-turn-helix domain-containing protein [Halosegnis marinus]|uniref:ArsR/SmtB family transcription factor n=1 Tax=Halosegnis marinus TaxID=3034023 RepID=UPI003075BAB6